MSEGQRLTSGRGEKAIS